MKVFVSENNYGEGAEEDGINWYLIADSAVSNTGKPFYKPEGKGRVSVVLGAAVRMTRLGKSISPKFSSRYYSDYLPALHFRLTDYRRELADEGKPQDASVNFDRSLFVGEPYRVDEVKEISLTINGELAALWSADGLKKPVDQILADISTMNTIKMGDLLLPGVTKEREVKEGDRLEVMVNGEPAFQVKVK